MNGFTYEQISGLQRMVRSFLGFGIVASIGANVLHVLTRTDASHVLWRQIGGSVLNAFAPVVLFAATEMVTKIPVHSKVLGWIRLAITLLLAGGAGWISYWSIVAVATQLEGQSSHAAQYLYPGLIDGMMIVATISLIELGRLARLIGGLEQAQADAELAEVQTVKATARQSTAAERKALRDAQKKSTKYRGLQTVGERSAWSKQWLADYRKEAAKVAPLSPAGVTGGPVPTDTELAEITA